MTNANENISYKIDINIDKALNSLNILNQAIIKLGNDVSKSMQKAFSDTNKEFTGIGGAIATLQHSINSLNNTLKELDKTLNNINKQLLKSNQEMTALVPVIDKSDFAVNALRIAFVNMSQQLTSVINTTNNFTLNLVQNTDVIKNQQEQLLSTIYTLYMVNTAFQRLSAVIKDLLQPIITMGTEFDKNMRNFNSIAQVSEQEFRSLSAELKELALRFDITDKVTTLAKGMYFLISSGAPVSKALDLITIASKGASAGITSTEVSTRILMSLLNSTGKSTINDAKEYMDQLFAVVDRGIVTFDQLANNLGAVLATAKISKVPFYEIGGAIIELTKAGVSMSESETAINNLLRIFIHSSKEATEIAKSYGFELSLNTLQTKGFVGALNELIEKTNGNQSVLGEIIKEARASKAAFILAGEGVESFAKSTEYVKNAGNGIGTTQRVLNEQMKSFDFLVKNVSKNLDDLRINFFEILKESLIPILNIINNLINAFKGMDKETKQLILKISIIVGGLSGLLGILTALGFILIGLKNAFGLLTGSIDLLVRSIFSLIASVNMYRASLILLGSVIAVITLGLDGLIEQLTGVSIVNTIKEWILNLIPLKEIFANIFDDMVHKVEIFTNSMKTMTTAIVELESAKNKIKNITKDKESREKELQENIRILSKRQEKGTATETELENLRFFKEKVSLGLILTSEELKQLAHAKVRVALANKDTNEKILQLQLAKEYSKEATKREKIEKVINETHARNKQIIQNELALATEQTKTATEREKAIRSQKELTYSERKTQIQQEYKEAIKELDEGISGANRQRMPKKIIQGFEQAKRDAYLNEKKALKDLEKKFFEEDLNTLKSQEKQKEDLILENLHNFHKQYEETRDIQRKEALGKELAGQHSRLSELEKEYVSKLKQLRGKRSISSYPELTQEVDVLISAQERASSERDTKSQNILSNIPRDINKIRLDRINKALSNIQAIEGNFRADVNDTIANKGDFEYLLGDKGQIKSQKLLSEYKKVNNEIFRVQKEINTEHSLINKKYLTEEQTLELNTKKETLDKLLKQRNDFYTKLENEDKKTTEKILEHNRKLLDIELNDIRQNYEQRREELKDRLQGQRINQESYLKELKVLNKEEISDTELFKQKSKDYLEFQKATSKTLIKLRNDVYVNDFTLNQIIHDKEIATLDSQLDAKQKAYSIEQSTLKQLRDEEARLINERIKNNEEYLKTLTKGTEEYIKIEKSLTQDRFLQKEKQFILTKEYNDNINKAITDVIQSLKSASDENTKSIGDNFDSIKNKATSIANVSKDMANGIEGGIAGAVSLGVSLSLEMLDKLTTKLTELKNKQLKDLISGNTNSTFSATTDAIYAFITSIPLVGEAVNTLEGLMNKVSILFTGSPTSTTQKGQEIITDLEKELNKKQSKFNFNNFLSGENITNALETYQEGISNLMDNIIDIRAKYEAKVYDIMTNVKGKRQEVLIEQAKELYNYDLIQIGKANDKLNKEVMNSIRQEANAIEKARIDNMQNEKYRIEALHDLRMKEINESNDNEKLKVQQRYSEIMRYEYELAQFRFKERQLVLDNMTSIYELNIKKFNNAMALIDRKVMSEEKRFNSILELGNNALKNADILYKTQLIKAKEEKILADQKAEEERRQGKITEEALKQIKEQNQNDYWAKEQEYLSNFISLEKSTRETLLKYTAKLTEKAYNYEASLINKKFDLIKNNLNKIKELEDKLNQRTETRKEKEAIRELFRGQAESRQIELEKTRPSFFRQSSTLEFDTNMEARRQDIERQSTLGNISEDDRAKQLSSVAVDTFLYYKNISNSLVEGTKEYNDAIAKQNSALSEFASNIKETDEYILSSKEKFIEKAQAQSNEFAKVYGVGGLTLPLNANAQEIEFQINEFQDRIFAKLDERYKTSGGSWSTEMIKGTTIWSDYANYILNELINKINNLNSSLPTATTLNSMSSSMLNSTPKTSTGSGGIAVLSGGTSNVQSSPAPPQMPSVQTSWYSNYINSWQPTVTKAYVSKAPMFHSGGISNNNSDILAIIRPDEMILTKEQQRGLLNLITGSSNNTTNNSNIIVNIGSVNASDRSQVNSLTKELELAIKRVR